MERAVWAKGFRVFLLPAPKLSGEGCEGPAEAAAEAVLSECFSRWSPSEIAFSFNGGKDCTVILHMLARSGRLAGIRVVFFDGESGFPEVTAFMKEMEALYGFVCEALPGPKTGLGTLVSEGIKAVILGTRSTDPDGRTRLPLLLLVCMFCHAGWCGLTLGSACW